jgi:dolichyl-phosphate-mannose--protein O-mannosyl transferase
MRDITHILWPRVILTALLIVSAFFHFTDIGKLGAPIFDEMYFATFASNYANELPVSDIHPPLGKILYAVPLVLSSCGLPNISFLTLGYDHAAHRMAADFDFRPFGSFPYVPLRSVSALFGLLLIVAVYAFTSAVAKNEWAGALAAFLVAFDNAILVETRAILLNGMYLSLGLLALALLLKRHALPVLGGILLGLSLSVKLIGIVFVGPLIALVVIHGLTRKEPLIARRTVGRFLLTAGITFVVLLFLLNNITLPTDSRLLLYRELSGAPTSTMAGLGTMATTSPVIKAIGTSLIELDASVSGYLVGAGAGAGQSAWYTWPFLIKPPFYAATERGGFIFLDGNPIVWALAVSGLAFFVLSLRRMRSSETKGIPALMLVSWATFSLLPFAAFVSRPAYLYHYFPALIFLVCLFSLLAVEWLSKESFTTRWIAGSILVALVIAGFVALLPFTYGFPV